MKKIQNEILKLTADQVLLSILELASPFFESSRMYRISAKKIHQELSCEKESLKNRIQYLKNNNFINSFVSSKEKYFEITPQGLEKIQQINTNDIEIEKPKKWDGKWRVVIFDIPEDHRSSRNFFRKKLKELGFEKIQASVYTYPFECTKEIFQLSQIINETDHILIMISDIIQGENILIKNFQDKNILSALDIK